MPLLLRLFFIRRSKNNRRRSHAGSEGRTVFQKNRRARLSGAWACPDEGLLQRNWRACVQKNSGSVRAPWPYARRQDFLAASQERCGTGAFPQRLCTGRGRLQENAACQADASGCARGSVRPFKKIQPLVAGLQEDCASRSGAADPVQARAITKSDGCWRTRARGRESARALQRPAEDRGGLAAVRPWVARASASWAFHRPVGGICWRVWRGRGAGTVCEIQRYPAGSGTVLQRACREMREPGNTVAHRLCASGLWAIGKLAD